VSKVLVISWDGATFDVLDPLLSHGHMPNLAQLIEDGVRARLQSCIPPISAAAWVSFQTGKNPGKHGVFEFLSYVPGQYEPGVVNATHIKAQTLWDLLSQAGKRCTVINVPVTYPPKPINGLMVSGFLTPAVAGAALRQSSFTFPEELKEEIFQHVDYEIHAYPRSALQKGPAQFVRDLIRIEGKRLELAQYLAQAHDWDLCMVHVHSTDTLQHMLWERLQSVASASYLESELDQLVLEFFATLDQGIQRLRQLLDKDDTLILLSDHGFGPVTHTFHVNDWLMSEGFLVPRVSRGRLQRLRWAKKALKRLDVFNLRLRAGFLHRRSPLQRAKRRELASVADWSRTQAFALMGTECAGIYVNLKGREAQGIVAGDEYERVCQQLVERARHIPGLKEARAYRRQDLYHGPCLDSMRDVVLVPGEGYHIATALSETGQLLRPTPANLASGHSMEGILVVKAGAAQQPALSGGVTIFDLAPTILRLLDLPVPADMDGRALTGEADWRTRETVQEGAFPGAPPEGQKAYSQQEEEAVRRRLAALGYLD
jgi:predicted AlkP superfamily phosphohydrolase/phosphomutase